jgi:hypothetical protein
VIVISCEGVPFSDAPEWAFPQKDGRQVVITRAVRSFFIAFSLCRKCLQACWNSDYLLNILFIFHLECEYFSMLTHGCKLQKMLYIFLYVVVAKPSASLNFCTSLPPVSRLTRHAEGTRVAAIKRNYEQLSRTTSTKK